MVMKKDYVLWGALGCALVGTAHAEYTLATATGVNEWVALAVPGALDLYVVRALQARRDVFVAVLVMVAANVASHLVRAQEIPVDWRLHSAVGALAPLLLWRIYSLAHTRNRTELLWGLKAGEVPEGADQVPEPDPVGTSGVPVGGWPYLPGTEADLPCQRLVPLGAELMEACTCGYLWGLHRVEPPPQQVPDQVPAEWSAGYDTGVVSTPEVPAPKTYPEYLQAGDDAYLEALALYLDDCAEEDRRPTIKDAKSFIGVGQDRARRLLRYAGYPAEKEES